MFDTVFYAQSALEPIYTEPRKGDIMHSCLDNKKALDVLGWRPRYSLEDGLRETIRYYAGQSK